MPERRVRGAIEVLHPRWIHPPLAGVWNTLLLFLQLIRPLGKLRREWRFDLIDAHFGHPEGIAAAMLARWFRCPFFVTMRGGDETDKARAPGIRWVMQWALMEDRVITVSDPLRTFAISMGVPAARVAVIPNGIDSGVFYPRNRADERPRLAERLARILRAAIRLE